MKSSQKSSAKIQNHPHNNPPPSQLTPSILWRISGTYIHLLSKKSSQTDSTTPADVNATAANELRRSAAVSFIIIARRRRRRGGHCVNRKHATTRSGVRKSRRVVCKLVEYIRYTYGAIDDNFWSRGSAAAL